MSTVGRIGVKFAPPTLGVELGEEGAAGGRVALCSFELSAARITESAELCNAIKERLVARGVDLLARDRRRIMQALEVLADRAKAEQALASGQDLNAVAPSVLAQAKECMEQEFSARALRPGDEGFEYDKKVEFDECESDNSWD